MTVEEFKILLEDFNFKYKNYNLNYNNLDYIDDFNEKLEERNKYANDLMKKFCNLSKNTMLDFQNKYMAEQGMDFMDFTFKQNHKIIECIAMELLLPEVRESLGCEPFTYDTILEEENELSL